MMASRQDTQTETELVSSSFATRPATPDDAEFIAPLIVQASEGLSQVIWASLATGTESALDFGLARIRGTDSWISWRNAWIAEVDGAPAGLLVSYLHGHDMPAADAGVPPAFVPLIELEALAPDSRYIFVLSTLPAFQGRGVGSRLLALAEALEGTGRMSVIVTDGNPGARRLYERTGYRTVASRPIVPVPGWDTPGTNYVLMIKPAAEA